MRKFGIVQLKAYEKRYNIVWFSSGINATRFDVIENLEDYNIIDTSNCEAAYIASKGAVKYYGDSELVALILRTIADASTFQAQVEQKMSMTEGVIRITQSKEMEKLSLRWYTIMEFGLVKEEFYETAEAVIVFDSVDSKDNDVMLPINNSLYVDYGRVNGRLTIDKTVGEYYSLEYLKARYPLEHMSQYDFVVVESMEQARERLRIFKEADTKVKAIDIEATGLDWWMLGEDVLVGVVLSWNENESTYYPFRQQNFEYNLPISFLTEIVETVNSQPADVMIIGHNAKVEKQYIWKESKAYVKNSPYAMAWDEKCVEHAPEYLDLRIDGDSMLLSILDNPTFIKGIHGLKHLAAVFRGVYFLELTDVFRDKKDIKFNVLPKEIVKYYACPDTANTICVWNILIKKFPKDEIGILDLEDRLISLTSEMEFYGMRTKREYLLAAIENEQYIVDMLADMFKKIHKTSANINSNDVRRDIFYNKLRAPVKVRTKTGAPSTSNEALKAIIESGRIKPKEDAETAGDILDKNGDVVIKGKDLLSNKYPSLVILNAYAKHFKELGALKRIDRKSKQDRVHFSLNQAGAATGRATSDAHQYSDAMKKAILADTSEYNLWSSDFKQVELRILPFVAKQQDLIDIETDMDVDVHRAILSILSGKPIWAISAAERKKGKSTNFGVVYKMSPYGLAKKNKGPDYTEEDYIEALNAITDFYNGFPHIKAQMEKNEHDATTYGYLSTMFGRRRYFKELLDPTTDKKRRNSLVRAANNFPIQGFGADLLKICQCNVMDYIHEKGWDKFVESEGKRLPLVRVMLPIHDELLVSSHKSIPPEEIIMMFKVCMEVRIAGAPPFFSAPAMVKSWYDGKLDAYELDLHLRDEIIEAWVHSKKRLIYSDTYDSSLDWKQAMEMQEHCRHLRSQIIQSLVEELIQEDKREDAGLVAKVSPDDLKTKISLNGAKLQERKVLINSICSDMFAGTKFMRTMSLLDAEMEALSRHYTLNNDRTLTVERLLDDTFDWYLESLSEYRGSRLKKYMDELIRQYKTVDEVASHVQHPELTHTLISIKIRDGEKFEHIEAIHEAVRRYMDDGDIGESKTEIVKEYDEDRKNFADFDELSEFIQFDDDGTVIEDQDEEDAPEEDLPEEDMLSFTDYKRNYCTYMLSDVIIDLSEFDDLPATAEEMNQAIARLCKPKEYYRVQYLRKGKLWDTKLRIGYIPEEVDKLFYAKKEVLEHCNSVMNVG